MSNLLAVSGGIVGAMLGLLFIVCFFVVSLIAVMGVKSVCVFLSRRAPKEAPAQETVKPARKPKKPVRSIEIDPDEIDRIVVKKPD